ncbi:DUF885 family protein [Shewanella sp. C32]|uniref:DUF885 family protein n=1 Tax=Shewanella electrica TaxID=515560 RepID=A0ABT2FLR4_9GAMM|nr:DUF885 family protein [Shewanella electrica]MCH1924253.1 DUF885 family protein [Shewanella electrica]MCS4556156.1 DUF885 family protein [Shewanella electrica]
MPSKPVFPRMLLLASMLALQPLSSAMASSADQAFENIYKTEWQWRQDQNGVDEDSVVATVPSSLPDVSLTKQQANLSYWQNVQQKLSTIDSSKLSPDNQMNLLVYQQQIGSLISDITNKVYERPLTGDTSFWGDLTYMTDDGFHTEQDYRNYIQWLQDMPRYFKQNIANMRAGMERGFVLPKISLQGRDATAASVVDAKGADNIFYRPFTKMPTNLPAKLKTELQQAGLKAISEAVIPAHKLVLDFLRNEYIPHGSESLAAYDLPDGKAFYQSQINTYTTLDLSAEQIHQIGLDEVARIKQRMFDVMKQVQFDGSLKEFLDFLRTDPQFYVKTPQALLDRAAWIAKEFDGKAAQYFGRLPRSRFAVIPVPDDIAPYYTAGRGGPGVYLVNTYNLPARSLYSLPALTLHESAPGHAFQMPLAAENKALPEFRRNYYISAFGEGWALYSEKLGEEMGMYHTPYEVFGMLSYQMWRAARLVVDTGIHAKHWSRKQAQDYMLDNTALSTHEVTTEVDRYIAWPGQALSYYLGEMSIVNNRQKAEQALGEKFDIRAFHDTVLQMGSVPLSVLDARIDQFIADGGKSPYQD